MSNNWTGGNDNWTQNPATDWSTGKLPTSSDDVIIAQGDPQVTSNVGAVNSVTDGSELQLENGGALTVTTFLTNTGTLGVDDSNYAGGSTLTVKGTLTNSGTFNLGNTATSSQGGATKAAAAIAQTIVNTGGTINIASASTTVPATLTINSTAGFGATGTTGKLVGNVNLQNDTSIVFASGQISDIAAGGELTLINADSYIADAGTTTSNSALAGLTTIEGNLTLFDGASISTTGNLSNTGTINVDVGFGIGGGGSSLTIKGTLTNSGTVGIGDPYVDQSKPSTVTVNALSNSGTLNIHSLGSTYLSSLVVKGAAGFGTTGSLTGQVNLSEDAAIIFTSGQISDIAANSELTLANSNSFIADANKTTSNSALTSLATIEGSLLLEGGGAIATGSALVNTGTLQIQYASSFSSTGVLTNTGNVDLDTGYGASGSTLTVAGFNNTSGYANFSGGSTVAIAGTLTNTATVNINSSAQTATSVTVAAINNTGGTLNVGQPGALSALDVTGGTAGFGTTGEMVGTVDVYGNALIEFASGQISDVVGNLELDGSQTRIADASSTSGNSALAGLTTIDGTLDICGDTLTTTSSGLTNNGTLDIDYNYDYGDGHWGGSTVTIAGTLTNKGTVNIGDTSLQNATSVTVAAINNTGATLSVVGTSVQATLDVTGGAAGFGTTGEVVGNVTLQGDALIEFASGQISDVAGYLDLNGSASRIADASSTSGNSALAGLTTIDGTLDIRGDTLTTTSSGLTNNGTLDIDDNYDYGDGHWGGSTVTIAGTLTNKGTVNIGDTSLQNATSVTVAAINNTGATLNVVGTSILATLDVTGGVAGFGTTGEVVGNVTLQGNALIEFASGQISDVVGYLDLNGSQTRIADSSSTSGNSALTGLTTIDGALDIRGDTLTTTSSGLTNNGTLDIDDNYDYGDGHWGGSIVTIAGTLTNKGTVNIGDTSLQNATSVTVAAINNTGATLSVVGTSVQATLDVTGGAAGFGTTGEVVGNVTLQGDALIEFASGQISDVAGYLDLNGSESRIADASSTSGNSALAGLTTIDGTLDVRGDTLTTTSSGLTNNGTLDIDYNYDYGDGHWGGSTVTIAGTLTNKGTVNIGDSSLQNATSVTVAAINNTGAALNLVGSGVLTTLDVTGGAAGFGTAAKVVGNVTLQGDALIEFASGQISDVVGYLDLNGSESRIADASSTSGNSALAGLTTIDGTLDIRGDTLTTTSSGLTNKDTLDIDYNYDYGDDYWGGSTVTLAGKLTNKGTVNIGDSNLQKTTNVAVGGIINTGGTINIQGSSVQATLNVTGGTGGFGTTGQVVGTVDLYGNAVIEFVSGQISDVVGALVLDGSGSRLADAASPSSNSALVGLTTIDGSLDLRGSTLTTTGAGLNNNGSLFTDYYYNYGDGHWGGSTVTVGGTLTNKGTADIGDTSLQNATTVSTSGLVNTGTISLAGGSAKATLNVNGLADNNGGSIYANAAAAFTINGTFEQGISGSLTLQTNGTTTGQYAVVATTGNVSLLGGKLVADFENGLTPTAGQTFNLLTFTPGELAGIFNNLSLVGYTGNGTSVALGNNLTAGLVYNNAAGNVQLDIVATPTTTADTWTGGTGSWSTNSNWANGAPTFYSDVTIGSTSTAKVTLTTDATINSLTLNASDSLTTSSGTDLSIGSAISLASGASLVIGGEAFVGGGLTNAGTITVSGQTLDIRGNVTGAGSFAVGGTSELELGGSDAETVTFASASGTLALDQPANFTGTLTNLVIGDAIDLGSTAATHFSISGSVLTVTLAQGTSLNFNLSNFATGAGFSLKSDNAGGSKLVVIPLPTVTVASIEGNDIINKAEAHATSGVPLAGTVTGIAAGATFLVSVVDGSFSKTYTAKVGSGGTWTTTIPTADATSLANGTAKVSAQVTDVYGNTSTVASQTVLVDETAPATPAAPTLTAASDSGTSNSDGITNDTTPTFTGTAEAGSTVTLLNGTVKIGTAVASSSGAYSITSSTLASKSYSLTVTATDAAGNVSAASAAVKIVVDATAPAKPAAPGLAAGSDTGSSATDGITNDKTPTVTGKAEAGATVTLYDGATIIGTAVANSSGVYTITASSLADGSHSLTVTATDVAGNVSAASPAKTVVIDTVAPSTPAAPTLAAASDSGSSSTDGITKVTKPTVTGTAEKGSTVTLYDGTTKIGSAVATSSGTYSIVSTATLATGSHTLTVTATDAAGNVSAASPAKTVVIDTTAPATPAAPTLSATSDSGSSNSDDITNVTTPTFTGTAEAGATVTLLDGTTKVGAAVANSSGAYSITSSVLASKSHSLTVTATDAAGNVSAASAALTVVVDTKAPSAPGALSLAAGSDTGSSATDGITSDTTPTVTGTAEDNASVTLYDGTKVVGTGVASASGAYSITTSVLAEGSHSLTAKATDAAGNVSAASAAKTVVIDTTAPAVSITSAGGTVTTATQTVDGSGEVGSVLALTDNGTAIGKAITIGSSGTWSEAITLSSGSNAIVATDTDKAGNQGTSSTVNYQYGAAAASMHSLVQAMATMTPASSATTTPTAPGASTGEHQLAVAH